TPDADRRHIPISGPAIVTANHPFGILDAAILASLLTKIRPDVRFLANSILTVIPELRDLIIPVDLRGGSTARALPRAIKHLQNGGMLVVFPAGEVAHFGETEWNPTVARLVSITKASVVPIHVSGANSAMFHIAGLVHPVLRTALLGRELLNKRGRRI